MGAIHNAKASDHGSITASIRCRTLFEQDVSKIVEEKS